MTINELKRALVEVSELCRKGKCMTCPLSYEVVNKIPECPLCDDNMTLPPAYWATDKLEEGAK